MLPHCFYDYYDKINSMQLDIEQTAIFFLHSVTEQSAKQRLQYIGAKL